MLSCVWFFCDPMDYSPPRSSVPGFPSQQYLSGLPFPPLRNLQNLGTKPASSVSPALALGGFFTTAPPGKPQHVIRLWSKSNSASPAIPTCFFSSLIFFLLLYYDFNCYYVVLDLLLFVTLCVIVNISYKWKGGLSGGLDSKESACNARDQDLIPGLRRSPGERKWQPTPIFLPGESHGQRRLASYSPWGHKESDMTGQLTLLLSYRVSVISEKIPWTSQKNRDLFHCKKYATLHLLRSHAYQPICSFTHPTNIY